MVWRPQKSGRRHTKSGWRGDEVEREVWREGGGGGVGWGVGRKGGKGVRNRNEVRDDGGRLGGREEKEGEDGEG